MGASEVSICNMALSWLGAKPLIALGDDTVEGRLCKANYEPARDAVLEIRDWSFAIARFAPASAIVPPDELLLHNGFSPFVKPADMLRMITVCNDPTYSMRVGWHIEGNYIWARGSIIYIKYVFRQTDPTKFSATFSQALAAFLAADLAVPIAGSREMQQLMAQLFGVKLETAGAFDGMQGTNEVLRSTKLTGVR